MRRPFKVEYRVYSKAGLSFGYCIVLASNFDEAAVVASDMLCMSEVANFVLVR